MDAVVKRKIPSPRRESNLRTPIIQGGWWMELTHIVYEASVVSSSIVIVIVPSGSVNREVVCLFVCLLTKYGGWLREQGAEENIWT
jgi:hypothetical protein